ncbi:flagellar hook-basal body complex protein FliE [Ruminococcaceae bacterium OttesenSCG-928-L11]|nr:flagellar hook-basal body complex protein FliE [Ruminococcaceae bacterium OttesenSCG-928-L11]
MNIIPISSGITSIGPVGGGPNIRSTDSPAAGSFSEVLKSAVDNLENLEAVKNQDSYDLSIGNVDDLAEVMANSQKYELSLTLMVQMRNKLLDSYSEIMRLSI